MHTDPHAHAPAHEPYAPNAGPTRIAQRLRDARRVVILTHVKPDGDAVGSSLALARTLLERGAHAEAWYLGPFPPWLDEVAAGTPVRKLSADNLGTDALPEPDAVAVVDTGAWSQVDALGPWLRQRAAMAALVDHHRHGSNDAAALRWIDPGYAAAAEMIAEVVTHTLGLGADAPLPAGVARAIYMGLATDTGWFKFSSTTPRTLRLAARLMESGAAHTELYEMLEQRHPAGRPRLLGRALGSLRMIAGGRVAAMSLRQQDFADCDAKAEDVGGFAEQPMAIAGVRAVVIFTEMTRPGHPSPVVKASLRSRPGTPRAPAVDVSAIAARFGGGGHVHAAGVRFAATLEDSERALLEALQEAVT
ncbi:MAG: hypothetical protein C0513_07645 [Isosphaera sp.]|nr:hypothetical protein [Isosphaera sp.]